MLRVNFYDKDLKFYIRMFELYRDIFTSSKEVMFLPMSVCWLVCLCVFVTRITQTVLSGFPRNWLKDGALAKEEPIKFWCGSG